MVAHSENAENQIREKNAFLRYFTRYMVVLL